MWVSTVSQEQVYLVYRRRGPKNPNYVSIPKEAKRHMWALWALAHILRSRILPSLYRIVCAHCGRANHFCRLGRSKTRAKPEAPGRHRQRTRGVADASIHVTSVDWNTGQNPRRNLNQVRTTSTYSWWTATSSHPAAKSKIADISVKMVVDTATNVNILESRTYDRIKTAGQTTAQWQ